MWICFQGLFEGRNRRLILVLVGKDGSEGSQRAGMVWVDLRRLGKRLLRPGQIVPPDVQYAEKVKDIGVVGCECSSSIQVFLSVVEFVLLKRLEAQVNFLLCLGS